MNGAHLHLMLVHFPIAGTFLALLLLLAAAFLKNDLLKRTGLVLVILCGVMAYAADRTGEKAAGVIRNLPDVERPLIREHAMAADWAVRSLGIGALLSILGLFVARKHGQVPGWNFWVVTVVTLWACTIVARVGYLGGQIRHPETRAGFTAPEAPQGQPVPTPAARK